LARCFSTKRSSTFFPVKYGLTSSEAQTYAGLRELIAQIPCDASVAATERELPHLSNREWAYALRSHHGYAAKQAGLNRVVCSSD